MPMRLRRQGHALKSDQFFDSFTVDEECRWDVGGLIDEHVAAP